MPTRKATRKAMTVERDSDGGLTIHDPDTDLVVSIITTHPLASGPRGLFIEVYDYRGRDVMAQDATRPSDTRHPTTAYYPSGK